MEDMSFVDEDGKPLDVRTLQILKETSRKGGKRPGAHVYQFINNKTHRRTKYNKATKVLIEKARQLEVMTGSTVHISVTNPTYAKRCYPMEESPVASGDSSAAQAPTTSTASTGVQTALDDTGESPDNLSPSKRVRVTAVTPSTSRTGRKLESKNRCRICFGAWSESDGKHWVGCSHLSRRGRATCQMWVHSACIWLHCTSEREAKGLPIYCPEHMPRSSGCAVEDDSG